MNPMRKIRIAKVTLNIGAGKEEDRMKKAIKLLERISNTKVVKAFTTKRIPSWGVRPGLALGCKTTLRGTAATELLKNLLAARNNVLPESCFDDYGNVSFGVDEYINIPGMKYDPQIGMLGLHVSITLERPGFRIKRRKLKPKKISSRHRIFRADAIEFMKSEFSLKVGEEE